MSAALQGAPVNDDAGQRDAGQRDPGERVVNDIPVNEVPVNELPVNETLVNELAGQRHARQRRCRSTTLPGRTRRRSTSCPVNEIMARNTSPAHSPVNEMPGQRARDAERRHLLLDGAAATRDTVDCRTATLGQAYAAGAIRPGVTLGDLRRADGGPPNAFDGVTLGDLHFFGDVTLARAGREPSRTARSRSATTSCSCSARRPRSRGSAGSGSTSSAAACRPSPPAAPTLPYEATFDVRPGPGGASGSASGRRRDDASQRLPLRRRDRRGSSSDRTPASRATQIGDPTESVLAERAANASRGRCDDRRRQGLSPLLHRAARPDPRPAGGLARRDARANGVDATAPPRGRRPSATPSRRTTRPRRRSRSTPTRSCSRT